MLYEIARVLLVIIPRTGTAITVDPNNPDRVFFDTFDVWFATRTGTVWNDTTCGYSYAGSAGPVHVDQRTHSSLCRALRVFW